MNNYVYHRVPEDMAGSVLAPLNRIKETQSDLYKKNIAKYKDRETLIDREVKCLNCLWNDVLFLSPIHPKEIMLSKQLAPELIKLGITINAIDPGPTDTGWMTKDFKEALIKESTKGKITLPEDIARLIISILLDDTRATGQVIHAER